MTCKWEGEKEREREGATERLLRQTLAKSRSARMPCSLAVISTKAAARSEALISVMRRTRGRHSAGRRDARPPPSSATKRGPVARRATRGRRSMEVGGGGGGGGTGVAGAE